MVGYGVQTAKGGKNGEAISLFISPCLSGKIQGSSGVLAGFLILASKISIWINLCFYINSLTSKIGNEQGTQLKHFYQILFMRVAL